MSILRITLTAFSLFSLFMDNETQLLKKFDYVNTNVNHRRIMAKEITLLQIITRGHKFDIAKLCLSMKYKER